MPNGAKKNTAGSVWKHQTHIIILSIQHTKKVPIEHHHAINVGTPDKNPLISSKLEGSNRSAPAPMASQGAPGGHSPSPGPRVMMPG